MTSSQVAASEITEDPSTVSRNGRAFCNFAFYRNGGWFDKP
jgi:hypothetical protein